MASTISSPSPRWLGQITPWLVPVAILTAWQAAAQLGWLSTRILPAPSAVLAAAWTLAASGELLTHLKASFARAAIGSISVLGALHASAAVKAALADAGLSEDEIDYVNAHGTSTPENDKMEHLSLSTVFGERIGSMPVSSNKSMIGHTLSAAGAVEAAFSLMTMRESVIPPTINYDNPDPAIVLDVVPNKKRNAEVGTVLSNSFGFGGQNTCLVMAREPV